jgi:hypothetical protein
MSKAILVVHTRPVSADREDEYNAWYNDQHLDDVVAVPGYGTARRYVLSDARPVDGVEPSEFRYLAIYELDTDDVEAAAQSMKDAVAAGMHLSEALDGENMAVDFYVPIEGAVRVAK